MRAIVEILSGSQTGRKLEIFPGRPLRFGRTNKSDLALTDDSYLSSLHFQLESDGEKCVLQDLGSSNGTYLNGTRVSQATLQHGDSIAAGQTNFLFHMYRDLEPPPPSPSATTRISSSSFVRVALPEPQSAARPATATVNLRTDPPPLAPAQEKLANLLRAEPHSLYALLDGSRDRAIGTFLQSSGAAFEWLWGTEAASTPDFAPCLVGMQEPAKLLEDLIRMGWSRYWGVYLTSEAAPDAILAHLRRFLRLRTEDGETFQFRFHDPRILRALLPSSTPHEAEQLFGPISRYLMEAQDPSILLRFEPTPLGVRQTSEALTSL
jgi:hypothetical protein